MVLTAPQSESIQQDVRRELAQLESDFVRVSEWLELAQWNPKGPRWVDENGSEIDQDFSIGERLDRLQTTSAVCLRDGDRSLSGMNSLFRDWFTTLDDGLAFRSEGQDTHSHGRLDELSERMLRSGAVPAF
ncbi:hypothetical protein [Neorhodopirellula pilleata]|uniref:hypothetical protein n=1 Tax=Neorhodopirellula pilleata TaxID=2714738 RepID=UPI0011B365D9|nr:hypothetical protein [Neorhodopirellula pilleata]